jgi:hypothetical protein
MNEVQRMVFTREAHLGFGDLADPADIAADLRAVPVWQAHVVLISPPAVKLPPAVPVKRLGDLPLVLPPTGSERRSTINALVEEAGGRRPAAALSTDERSAWISSAQQGIASFLSYEAVGVELDGVRVRPFDPPIHVPVGFVHRVDEHSAEMHSLLHQAMTCEPPPGCSRVASVSS